MSVNDSIRLTQFSRGAGCGCKIAPQVLREIISSGKSAQQFASLLVGNETSDDAAVLDIGGEHLLVSTTDFFMPIVDDAFDFGRVAAANAISDVYAMGGKPVLALAILGWPIDKLPAEIAAKVVEGGRHICAEAGIPLAGGHTVDAAEPFFGLAVNGLVKKKYFKKNSTAQSGDLIFLTKALGTGILSTAQKRGLISEPDAQALISQLVQLNSIGERIAEVNGVTAMTDVTGFGLLGHLIEMAEGSGLAAQVNYRSLQLMPGISAYLKQNIVPDATYRNWNSCQKKVKFESDVPMPEAFQVLPDPQTNGGLMIAINPGAKKDLEQLLSMHGLQAFSAPIGTFLQGEPGNITVTGLLLTLDLPKSF